MIVISRRLLAHAAPQTAQEQDERHRSCDRDQSHDQLSQARRGSWRRAIGTRPLLLVMARMIRRLLEARLVTAGALTAGDPWSDHER